jgi:rod shape-determining protein MreC
MKQRIVLIILFIIGFFFFGRYGVSWRHSVIGNIPSCFLYPVLRIQQWCIEPVQRWFYDRATVAQLRYDCYELCKERDFLLSENIAFKAEHAYQSSTTDVMAFKKRYERTGEHIVQILARHLSHNNQFFLINAGSYHGVEKDMVALYGNCLLGRVTHVYPWYCHVSLITDPLCKIGALCAKTGAMGIHEGLNSTSKTIINHVSHLDKVEIGDMILSSGEGLIFPQGFSLGIVESCNKGDLCYTIYVRPLVDFAAIRYCTLVAKSDIEMGKVQRIS